MSLAASAGGKKRVRGSSNSSARSAVAASAATAALSVAADAAVSAACAAAGPAAKRPKRTASHSISNGHGTVNGTSSSVLVYPPPLFHPGDELDLDPDCPEQSLGEWRADENRNKVTKNRKTIYVVAPPKADEQEIDRWAQPTLQQQQRMKQKKGAAAGAAASDSGTAASPPIPFPQIEDVAAYIRAVFHPLDVKILPALTLTAWDASLPRSSCATTSAVPLGLNTGSELVRIRTRLSADGCFPRQLNLSDLLDAAMGMLPSDAYALVFLVAHDLYESKEDVFTCGRAFGGDRVAVISTARYNPALDALQELNRDDVWPLAHFAPHAPPSTATKSNGKSKAAKRAAAIQRHDDIVATCAPLHAAVKAHNAVAAAGSAAACVSSSSSAAAASSSGSSSASSAASSSSSTSLAGLWLGRVCKTASHELGHCFCLEHCVSSACAMQGSANVREDARQPPYLCPLDHAKLTQATGSSEAQREQAVLAFCDKHPRVQLFAAYAAWIRAKMQLNGGAASGPAVQT